MTPNKPRIIGLTGGIACGKSSLSAALRAHGASVVDADEIARALTAPGGAMLPALRARFGEAIFDGEQLNRARLAALVFEDKNALEALNAILHPAVFEQMDKQMAQLAIQAAIVVDVPLLYETGYEKKCDEVWCAWAPERVQLARLTARGLSEAEARARIHSQMPAIKKALLADRVIITTGSLQSSATAVTRLWDEMQRRYTLV